MLNKSNFHPTPIKGLLEIVPDTQYDDRGWFMEMYKQSLIDELNPSLIFVQENISFSQKGVLRGLHLQLPPAQQAKIVTVLQGKVLDVVVDLRSGSKSFGNTFSIILDATRRNGLLIPEGFAHGFLALENTLFLYKCSSFYNPEHETGIYWNDEDLNIDWDTSNPLLSAKDRTLPTLRELKKKHLIPSS